MKQGVQAGTLNTRVTIERKTGGTNDWGEPLPESWTPVATVWANVRHLSGSEAIKADAVTSTVRASIRVRWRADVTAAMRVVYGATTFEIKAVLPDEQRREHVDLVCEATR